MDIETRRTYVRLRLARAQEDLATARDDVAYGHLRAGVIRAYYAAFHTASAALLWLNIERIRHSGVQSAFGEFLVKPGVIDGELGAILGRARKLREAQDYDLDAEALSDVEAAAAVSDAERFVIGVTAYLNEEGALIP